MSTLAATLLATRPRGLNNANDSSARIMVVGFAKMLLLLITNIPFVRSSPISRQSLAIFTQGDGAPADDPSLWAYLGTAVALVLLGGAFAGLTIALMGQDEIYLQVIATSGEGSERRDAKRVLKLLKRGKHWVLVTLLLSNVITNETLPIVLDRSLGGGWPAVLSSTVLIVIFGEIAPQSVCVRYGLPIGAWMSPFVLCLMWILAPVAWPTAKLLDKLLGEDHGTTYKKAGLKTLVTLHKTLGTSPDDRLNEDEVTIISAVLDLKGKPVGSIMTPMSDVFTLSADSVLDEDLMDIILLAGYSRIPIYAPDNPRNFIGMLLVKMLITYDPEDCLRVRDFALATLPETQPETSCLDIVNFFQEGKSHMVLVSDYPGEPYGALGVVTLEDVIEELIGEEIIDESDVFIDVHKAIRRMNPAPRYRVPKGEVVTDSPLTKSQEQKTVECRRHSADAELAGARKFSGSDFGTSPRATTFLMRRRSSGAGNLGAPPIPVALRSNTPEIKHHLKHLGPSNAASRPKSTRINTVKIKPGVDTIPESSLQPLDEEQSDTIIETPVTPGGVGEGLLASAGRQASDGVHALTQGYGTLSSHSSFRHQSQDQKQQQSDSHGDASSFIPEEHRNSSGPIIYQRGDKFVIDSQHASGHGSPAHSTVASLRSLSPSPPLKTRLTVRSGSITESFVDLGGIKKLVLETTSSSEENDHITSPDTHEKPDGTTSEAGGKGKKKQRKKRAGKKKRAKSEAGEVGASKETSPLLGNR